MTHPLESRRWAGFADSVFPRFVRASEKIADGIEKMAELIGQVRDELAELRQYKEEVQDEADEWIEEIERFLIHCEQVEQTDTGDANELLRNVQAFLCEKVNEGASSV